MNWIFFLEEKFPPKAVKKYLRQRRTRSTLKNKSTNCLMDQKIPKKSTRTKKQAPDVKGLKFSKGILAPNVNDFSYFLHFSVFLCYLLICIKFLEFSSQTLEGKSWFIIFSFKSMENCECNFLTHKNHRYSKIFKNMK